MLLLTFPPTFAQMIALVFPQVTFPLLLLTFPLTFAQMTKKVKERREMETELGTRRRRQALENVGVRAEMGMGEWGDALKATGSGDLFRDRLNKYKYEQLEHSAEPEPEPELDRSMSAEDIVRGDEVEDLRAEEAAVLISNA